MGSLTLPMYQQKLVEAILSVRTDSLVSQFTIWLVESCNVQELI